MVDVLLYTPGGSGTGQIFRFHNLANALLDRGILPHFVFGSNNLPPSLKKVSYERTVLSRPPFDSSAHRYERQITTIDEHQNNLKNIMLSTKPSVFISSHHAGIAGELDGVLKCFKKNVGGKCILAWRDIPCSANEMQELVKRKSLDRIVREYYDIVAVFGQREIISIVSDLGFPEELQHKVQYFGFVVPPEIHLRRDDRSDSVIFSFGGGENRINLLRSPVARLINVAIDRGLDVTLVEGKIWSEGVSQYLEPRLLDKVKLVKYGRQDTFFENLSSARFSVVAGGYNSTYESLACGANTIICADTGGDRIEEVLYRAEILSHAGFCKFANSGLSKASAQELFDLKRWKETVPLDYCGAENFVRRIFW